MIEYIKASATFITPTKSWSFSGELSPPPGITAVIGRNGSGKSLLAIETPRYLLFGKRALRGSASDYKTYVAEGIFKIHGKRYQIKRSAKREEFIDLASGTVEAVGAEAVTAKVIETLGYGLDVFDLANAAVQKQTDRLGQLRPAERKALIDQVVGLASYERVEKACRDEAKKLRGIAEGLTQTLRAPVEPTKPDGYFPSHVCKITLERERELHTEYAVVRQAESMLIPKAPVPPEEDRVSDAEVDAAVEAAANVRERQRLQRIIDEAAQYEGCDRYTEEQLMAATDRLAAKKAVANRGPQPSMGVDEIDAAMNQIVLFENYKPSDEVECPSCGTSFRLTGVPPDKPLFTRGELREQQDRWAKHREEPPMVPEGLDLNTQQIMHAREANRLDVAAEEARASMPEAPVDQRDPASLRAIVKAWAVYDRSVSEWDTTVASILRAKRELELWLEEHDVPDTDLEGLQNSYIEAKLYEQALARHEQDKADFAEKSAQIADHLQRASDYKAGSDALADARTTFKAHLAPMLSRIASKLVHDMSAGELSAVVVDDEMEITVDGQRIETLSGAGETVANLALRIALGQALVADAFPVFLGDEIDSDADEQRRAATKDALLRLKDRLGQIILITHRAVDVADLVIDMDNP